MKSRKQTKTFKNFGNRGLFLTKRKTQDHRIPHIRIKQSILKF